MKKSLIVVFSTLVLISASTHAAQAADSIVKLKVSAIGAHEPSGGALTGGAWGTFLFNRTKGIVCSTIKTRDLTKISGSHIHMGVTGVISEIVVTIDAQKFNISGENCVKVPIALVRAITANPSAYYFNVHTSSFPGGAVRGQLVRSK